MKSLFFVKLAGGLFLGSIFFGYWLGIANPLQAEKIIEELRESFSFLEGLAPFFTFVFIFFNNTLKAFLGLILGTFFGIIPFLFIFVNGELIGIMSAFFSINHSSRLIILGLLPHGLFEIPAFLIASGWGMGLGYKFYRFLRYKEPFRKYFSWTIKKYLLFIVPIFLWAAFVETYLTPRILAYFEIIK